ncbi:L-lactate permease [Gandjariella thermophila]|uniref:L-lactate permease n=1 Tax=Gandjariella thermophila TaxID=1931992 RepID=A0A4D4JD78_9PSEU|nr:L-lactate permease [Gandjariella thermophila]GDY33352.1 lactate permease [Gandjariella thermophila]
MFTQILDPVHSVLGSTLLALVPVAVLLVALALFRLSAWQAVIVGGVVTVIEAIFVWHAPAGQVLTAYGLGAGTGFWSIDWIVFWGVVIYHTMVVTGAFDAFKNWLVNQATADIRVQTILIAWAFGALLEGLVGFGYPWAVVAPVLIAFGIADLAAIRVAALANNAPVSYGALGAPIIGLAAVTGLPLLALSASIGKIVAVLALAPPWILIYLVSGRRGLRTGWPLAIVGSLGYILGQYPTSQWLGPYLPDIIGSLVCFGALLLLLRFWRPSVTLGYGGREITPAESVVDGSNSNRSTRAAWRGLLPFLILVVVVVAWTGPWSPLPKYTPFAPAVKALSSLSHAAVSTSWKFAPFVAGTAILVSWLLIAAYLRPNGEQLRTVFGNTVRQMWGALLVGPLIFGLAESFNFSGMANSMANGFAKVGTGYVILAPILGWIAVALSGSNTSANAVFGQFQLAVGRLLGAPVLLFPSLNSVGSEVGKPVAPQTASVGVATTRFVRNEGQVIRYNMGWTLIILLYLIGVGVLFYFVLPAAVRL